jgi:hypothetical protein
MTPTSFPERNITLYGEGCEPLPAFSDGTHIVSCWIPSDDEMKYLKKCIENGEKPQILLSVHAQEHPPVFIGFGEESVFDFAEEGGNG